MWRTSVTIIPKFVRNVHSSQNLRGKAVVSGPVRQVKIMNKLLFGRNKGKRGWYGSPSQGTLNQFPSVKSISNPLGVQKHTNRRITVLNKLFMKNITDLMATGDMAESISGLGIEVSRVLVSQDFQNINVYWLAKANENDAAIETLLKKCSGHLRHELSQLRVMGEVPRIHFVKDLEFAKFVEVERILKGADLGKDDIEESIDGHPMDDRLSSLPEMRHDVLGLNHSIMMSKITQKLAKLDQFKINSQLPKQDASIDNEDENSSLDDVWEAKRLQTIEREERFAEFLKNKRQSKIKNAVNRDDREFLLEQGRKPLGSQDECYDLEEEYDVIEDDTYQKEERRDQ